MFDSESAALVEALRVILPHLSERDRQFGGDLIDSVGAQGFATERQAFWLRTLADKATTSTKTTRKLGDMQGAIALFESAAKRLKWPTVVLHCEGVGGIKLSLAGKNAKVPGSITVTESGAYGEGKWYGRIIRDGTFDLNPREMAPPALIDLLRAFAADPARTAAEYGRSTGNCCFCTRALSDERSVGVGYGPICASRWGLPWGVGADRGRILLCDEGAS